ncbi:iron-containing redox enzyme family protein [Sphingomonas sp. ABOLD]|uniref:iron-containing redox enzyme family protein n=1 Tax=unclassified Sphingomonas TaxID=196159 RepID=UPI000F7F9538|nr:MULTISPECIES: iron-containing redox enzyme family protein [unclassified Sphingomonas]RSV43957.1 iron-containing redox enzyme family protein [Sphingomonas sp. ABOLE]RSV45838.1 iron-containing redox enzyme family protein [Sphingomonas sp. ABOLD]
MATLARDFAPRLRSQFLTDSFQRGLAHWNRERLEPGFPSDDWQRLFERDVRMERLQGAFLEELRAEVIDEAAAAPTDGDGFIAWFEGLKATGPGQGDPLFPWLAEQADRDQLRWFFEQEAAGEAGFDDLVAMTQVKLPTRPKLELARNYWDEMGHGTEKGMHGPMLDALVETLAVTPVIENTVWESLCLANAMTAMASSRRYAWHSVGALGVIELTAPGRSAATAEGLKRVGLSPKEARYFTLHAVLDIKHSEDWNREAIRPAVEEDPRRATAMAEGALIRLRCGARCFEAYRERLWG